VIRFAGVDLASAVQMAVQNGARLFPDLGSQIVPGAPANLLLFEYVRKKVVIHSTWSMVKRCLKLEREFGVREVRDRKKKSNDGTETRMFGISAG